MSRYKDLETNPVVINTSEAASADPRRTSSPNATAGPDDTTPSVLLPAVVKALTDPPIVNDSSSKETDNVEVVGSVRRCKDKINFIFNMLCERSFHTKCDEIRDIITGTNEKCLPWLAHYIVKNRISVESNYHTLYLHFLDFLNNETLNTLVTLETIKSIRVLLRRDKTKVNPSCKSLLKNLGHWFGMITLAKNKPIFAMFGDLKMLLVEAYYDGEEELLYTVPFVAKVLESCADSTVFNTTNPWTLSVLNCLCELYRQPNLKLTLQFEIELLCKKLKIELKDLKTTSYLLENKSI